MIRIAAIAVFGLAFLNVSGRWIAENALENSWSSFQRVYKKAYASAEEKTHRFVTYCDEIEFARSILLNSRQIWEENLSMIHLHNLKADMNLRSYRLAMNPFGDMVIIEEICSQGTYDHFFSADKC